MKITRFEQSCLLIEENGIKILTDLGSYNVIPDATDISILLITHEHQDHFDIGKIKELLIKNPDIKIITHITVGDKLVDAGIEYISIAAGEKIEIKGISIESFGSEHAVIYETSPCANTGYLIAGRLFMPGDALHDFPTKSVEILALPTGGPWMKLSEAIDYAKKINPKIVFPIHDAPYTDAYRETSIPRWIGTTLESARIPFINLLPGSSHEF